MSWTQGYKIPFHSTPVCYNPVSVYTKTEQERCDFNKSINKLLEINAISICEPDPQQFLSSVFLVPKPDGSKRFILNLKNLNKFVKTVHFKMEDYRTASKFITKDCFLASIDLQDAYFLIPIYEPHKKYLRFMLDDVLYTFNCLPFGLSSSPYVYTKIMKPVYEFLRSNNFISCCYLDDTLLIGKTYDECIQNVNFTKSTLENLGFLINYTKSCLIPKTNCKFLGFIFDSKNMQLKLPLSKINKIKDTVNFHLTLTKCKLRDFARLIGLLTSACPAVQFSWLYTKILERHKYLCLLDNPDYNSFISLPKELHPDLKWWARHVDRNCNPFRFNNFEAEIFTDSSTTGWGAYKNGKQAHGYWKETERLCHINELELKAAFFGLKVFAHEMYDCEILLRIDNTTAISCINRMGSVQFEHLNLIAREIWQWCEKRKIFVFASYINTKENIQADELSRKKFSDTEWELGSHAFEQVKHVFGEPKIDLFASRCNAKCSQFVTWKNDPDAWKVDAFTICWKNLQFYAFPPFALILKMLQKIIHDKAEGIVIVPNWPTQPWFPLFKKLIDSKTIHFHPSADLLTSPFRTTHSLHKTLSLVAAKLSGRRY